MNCAKTTGTENETYARTYLRCACVHRVCSFLCPCSFGAVYLSVNVHPLYSATTFLGSAAKATELNHAFSSYAANAALVYSL